MLRVLISARRLAFGILLLPASLTAGEAPSAAVLVQRLGDASFDKREQASLAVRELGRLAGPALEEGLTSTDAEIRRRCAELLPLARRSELDIRLDAFIAARHSEPAPFPGWMHFKKLAGEDRPARLLFISLGRADPDLLKSLEKDPSSVGTQLADRSRRASAQFASVSSTDGGQMCALLLAAACSSEKNTPAAHLLFNSLYQPGMRSVLRDNPAASRLLGRFLARQLDEPWRLHQAVWLARSLGLDEFMENTLKPEARKQAAAAAAKPDDTGNLFQAASLASLLGLNDTIETILKPAARKLAENSAEKPDDPGRLFQVLNVLQTLGMKDVIEATLRPAVCRAITAVARKPYDQYHFHMALNLSQSLQLKPLVDLELRPAALRALISISQRLPNDPGQIYSALNLVQTFDLKEASEDFLKPAARRLAATAARSGDLAKLMQAAHLVSALGIKETEEQILRPAVRKLAEMPTENANRLSQLIGIAQNLGMQDTIDSALKRQTRKALLVAQDHPAGSGTQELLQVARTLQMKEGVPLAVKAARAKGLNVWARSTALLFVAEFGSKDNISELEPLLTDSTSIGSIGLNFTTIHAELRDVTLAAVVKLSGQSIEDYEYPYLKTLGAAGPLSTFSAHCFGFADSASREIALKKWKQRSVSKK